MNELPILAKRIENIPFAGIRKVFQQANKLEAMGKKIIHFEIGRPDFDTPLHIKAAAKEALDKGFVHYAPNGGIQILKEAFAKRLLIDKQAKFDPDKEIMITAGGQEALYLTFMSILNPGDEVLIPEIGFGPFPLVIELSGGKPIRVPLLPAENYAYDMDAAQRAVTPKTKAILINSPHNPTGTVLSPEQIKGIAAFAEKNNLFLVCDEAYDKLVYEGIPFSPVSLHKEKERIILCGSLSKTYAMTGWRIGYMAASSEIIAAAIKMQQNIMLSVANFPQHAAAVGLLSDQSCVSAMVKEFDRRRKMIIKAIEENPMLQLDSKPNGAFYVFPKVLVPDVSSAEIADYLLNDAGVAVVDGAVFGPAGKGHIRISYATSYNDCCEGMERIKRALLLLTQKVS